MNTGTMSKRVTTVINYRKTYAALALAGLLALFSGAAAAEKAAEQPRHPAAQTFDHMLEELEQKVEVAERESPEESVRLLIQDRLNHFDRCRMQSSRLSAWEPLRRCLERDPRVAKLVDLARNGSEEQRASLLAEVKKMCRYFIEELRMEAESPDDCLPSVLLPAGALAYPLLLSVLDDKAETLPLLLAMRARHLEAWRKWRAEESEGHAGIGDEKAEQIREIEKAAPPIEKFGGLIDFEQVLAYACVELLGKYERSPALRSALSARQAQIVADFAERKNEFHYGMHPTPKDGFNIVKTAQVAQEFVQAADK